MTNIVKNLSENFEKDTTLSVGYFKLIDDKLKIKDKDKKELNEKDTIKKVIIDIKDGVIFSLQVITSKNRVYSNWKAPIEVYTFSTNRCDKLRCKKDNTYINTCDFLNYIHSSNVNPDDARFILTKVDETKKIYRNHGLNQVFNIRLFSDMLGVFGKESNGLVQTEVEFKTNLHNRNIKDANFYFVRHFRFNFNLSKFDDKFNSTSLGESYSRSSLNQRSWLKSEIGINIFKGTLSRPSSNTSISLDFIGGFALSEVGDSSNISTMALVHYGLNPSIEVKALKNLIAVFSSSIKWQFVPNLKNKKFHLDMAVITPQFEIAWNPLGSKSSKIFARVNYNAIINDNKDYWNFQLGYNLLLSNLVGNYLKK